MYKLALRKSFRGSSRTAETTIGGLEVVILKKAKSPRITERRGDGVTKKMARSLLIDAAGEVFLVPSIGTLPRPNESGCCAIFS
jgi:hypothetical protein